MQNATATLIPGGRTCDDGSRKADDERKSLRCQFLDFCPLLAVHAADLTSPPPPPPSPVPEAAPHWYVKLGALGALDQSWSSLFAQQVLEVAVPGIGLVPVRGVGPQVSLVGRGATYSSIASVSFVGGYFFTPNWSLEVAGGVPLWLNIRITGFPTTPPVSGASLSKLLPGAVPITGVYHFTQFGALQPYLGAGIVPSFQFAVEDGFNTGGFFSPTVGLVGPLGPVIPLSPTRTGMGTALSTTPAAQTRKCL